MAKRILTPLDQLLAALQFFATGTFQSVVGNVLKLSKRSAGRSIHGVANALCKIAPQHIVTDGSVSTAARHERKRRGQRARAEARPLRHPNWTGRIR